MSANRDVYELIESDDQDRFAAQRKFLEETSALREWLAQKKEEEWEK
jgi:hypothetical protein